MGANYLHAPEITDEIIMTAFEGTNFGRTDYRAFLGYSVLKKACHWHCGHTITTIMVELGLITPKAHRVTKLGRMFLSDCYDDPIRIKSAPAADMAELVPDEVDNWKNPASEAMRDIGYVGSKQDFTMGANWMRAAILRKIEEEK